MGISDFKCAIVLAVIHINNSVIVHYILNAQCANYNDPNRVIELRFWSLYYNLQIRQFALQKFSIILPIRIA